MVAASKPTFPRNLVVKWWGIRIRTRTRAEALHRTVGESTTAPRYVSSKDAIAPEPLDRGGPMSTPYRIRTDDFLTENQASLAMLDERGKITTSHGRSRCLPLALGVSPTLVPDLTGT